MKARRARHATPLLAAVLLVALVLALSGGAAWVAPTQWLGGDGLMHDLVWVWRAPRVAAAFFVGACLALAGLLFQGVFRNPLAEPYLLGSDQPGGSHCGSSSAMAAPTAAPEALPSR